MSKHGVNPRVLRAIAEDIIEKTSAETGFPEHEREDLVTSLVRQWLTYDYHAALFPDLDRQFLYLLTKTPLGLFNASARPTRSGWSGFIRDWKIDPDDVPDMLEQLNRGQSAEVINANGTPLRLYVNPKEGRMGIEPLAKENFSPPAKSEGLKKIAGDVLGKQLGELMAAEVKDDLIRSVVEQWRRYDGHACVFIDERHQLRLDYEDRGDRGSHVSAAKVSVDVRPVLTSLGFRPRDLSGVLGRINLGQEVEFQGKTGARSILGHDPKGRKFVVRTLGRASPQAVSGPPLLCPKCSGVLQLWSAGQTQQACPMCGQVVKQ